MSQFNGHYQIGGLPFGSYYGVYAPAGQDPGMITTTTYPMAFSHPQMGQQVRPMQVDHYHQNWQHFQPVMAPSYMQGQPFSQPTLIHGNQGMNYQGSMAMAGTKETNTFIPAANNMGQHMQMIGIYPRISTPMVSTQPEIQKAQDLSIPNQPVTEHDFQREPMGDVKTLAKPSLAETPSMSNATKLTEQVLSTNLETPTQQSLPTAVPVAAIDPSAPRHSSLSWMNPRQDISTRGRPGTTAHPAYKDINLAKFTADDFEFGPKIGKGKYGDVYLCKDKKTNFIVAIKVLDKMTIRQMRALRQIVREIKHHSYLKHENIIKLYGVFHDENKIYMIMEYACDGEIYKELKSSPGRKFSEEKASNYIKQVLEAINYLLLQIHSNVCTVYLHENDIIHRDIKPENLLKSFGQVKLADFGWSVYAPENKNKRKTFCGTLDYVPPEMVQGEKYDYHTDNWGIGILAYEFVTGQPPFGKKTMPETLDSIVQGELIIPDTVSKEAANFISEMLQSNPKVRMELSEALVHPWILKYNP